MKQETFITRLTMLLLFVGLAAYFGIYTWNSLNDPFSSALCYTHRVDNVVEAPGFVVREEVVLPRQNGVVDILPEEGEKVAAGETVAMVYKDTSALEKKLEIGRLELELEQLEYSLRQDSGRGDIARLDRDILDAIVQLRGDTATGDFSRLEENAMQLKSMVFHRNYTYNNNTESVESITAMIREQPWLMSIAVVFFAPLAEECLFRGWIFTGLAQRNLPLAYGVTACFFSAAHILGYVGRYDPLTLLLCFLQYLGPSIALCFSCRKADSLLAPMLLHMTINAIALILTR